MHHRTVGGYKEMGEGRQIPQERGPKPVRRRHPGIIHRISRGIHTDTVQHRRKPSIFRSHHGPILGVLIDQNICVSRKSTAIKIKKPCIGRPIRPNEIALWGGGRE